MSADAFRLIKQRVAALPRVASKVAEKVADAFQERARAAFDAGVGVYGDPFVGDHGPLDLVKTGKLREKSLRYEAHGSRVRASIDGTRYAKYRIKHGILPRPGQLPGPWQEDVDRIADEVLTDAVRASGGS